MVFFFYGLNFFTCSYRNCTFGDHYLKVCLLAFTIKFHLFFKNFGFNITNFLLV